MVQEHDFLSFVAGVLDVPAENLALDTSYGSIPEWDSVMHIRLTLEIESRYNVEVPVDEIADVKTLDGFYRYVRG